jgi:glyoxylase-like metal-dependent hydrolase (beta-lactamase superfamily II)/predicted ester cyclase
MPARTHAATAREYADALAARDVDAALALWDSPPEANRRALETIFAALPDLAVAMEDLVEQDDRVAIRWSARGTFSGFLPLHGIEPNGAPVALHGMAMLTIRDGLLVDQDVVTDRLAFARQIGLLPGEDTRAERRLTAAMNTRTRAARRLFAHRPVEVATALYRVQGGLPARCNVYFILDGDGVIMFDAGARTMLRAVAAAGASLGGIKQIILGHGHTDHRGTAPALPAPVFCHHDEVADAEGSGGFRYWGERLPKLPPWERPVLRWLHHHVWDGGPVQIAGTLEEDATIAGFRVVHLPGHAPGQIALYREFDGVALTSDAFYSIDDFGRDCAPRAPRGAWNLDSGQTVASLRKLAALDLSMCLPGHGGEVRGDVRAILGDAADAGVKA